MPGGPHEVDGSLYNLQHYPGHQKIVGEQNVAYQQKLIDQEYPQKRGYHSHSHATSHSFFLVSSLIFACARVAAERAAAAAHSAVSAAACTAAKTS